VDADRRVDDDALAMTAATPLAPATAPGGLVPPAAPPAAAFTCPRCLSVARPAPGPQVCGACGRGFSLHAGVRADPSLAVPPFDPRAPRIVVKSAGTFLYKRGMLAPEGVSEGTLDPVTGLIPMDLSGVLWADVVSVAVWRQVDVTRLVVALLIPVPITLVLLLATFTAWVGILAPAAFFGAIAAFMLVRAVGTKANYVRIVGVWRVITIRFDSPWWRRQRFHDELLRRAGIAPGAIP